MTGTKEYGSLPFADVDTEEIAKSPYGDITIQKFLYESGLQNVFNDYQKNIASLDQSKQKAIQDAYYIREMSKKYLGEYGSNIGVGGDLSGNLIDIYGQYQKNIGDINTNIDALKLNLDQEYQNARREGLQNILLSQYQIDVAKLDENAQNALFDIASGNTGGLSDIDYINKMYADGKITETVKNQYTFALQEENYNTALQNIQNGYYGGKQNSSEYLESIKASLSPKQYTALSNLLKQQETVQNALATKNIMSKTIVNEKGETVDNPYYVGDDYEFGIMVPGENVDTSSIGYVDSTGTRYFTVKDNADNDEKFTKSSEDLFDLFAEKYKNGSIDHEIPVNGDIISTTAYSNDESASKTVQYMYNNGTWYRLAQERPLTTADMQLWRSNGKEVTKGDNFKIDKNNTKILGIKTGDKADLFTINGVKIQQQRNDYFKFSSPETDDDKAIADLFTKVHSDGKGNIFDTSIVTYKGQFYIYKDGKIYSMKKKG